MEIGDGKEKEKEKGQQKPSREDLFVDEAMDGIQEEVERQLAARRRG